MREGAGKRDRDLNMICVFWCHGLTVLLASTVISIMLLGSYIFDFIFLKGSHIVTNCITIMALIRVSGEGRESDLHCSSLQLPVNIFVYALHRLPVHAQEKVIVRKMEEA